MDEKKKTLTFVGTAVILLLVAFITAPRTVRPDAFVEQGEPFFPDFEDPNSAVSLEVIEFDEETASAKPFKVTFKGTRWTIPSHHDYPADGKEQLAETAAMLIGIHKDDVRSDNVSDHEICGVVDPLDETSTALKGRGRRVTIRGEREGVLADLIIGKEVEDRENLYFVRRPGQKRIYVSKIDGEISTRFQDWIDKDLMQLEREDITTVRIEDYSVNERAGTIDRRDTLVLTREGSDWKANRTPADREVNSTQMTDLLRAIDELSIVGVRPKPMGLSESLTRMSREGMRITNEDVRSLASRGFYFTQDGSLVSNEGEIEVQTSYGVGYVLRFGEVLYGSGEAVSAGAEGTEDPESGPGENRYLFITTDFDPTLLGPEPRKPAHREFESKDEEAFTEADRADKEAADRYDAWEKKRKEGQETADRLNERFARWYYVISSASFDKVKVDPTDVLKERSN